MSEVEEVMKNYHPLSNQCDGETTSDGSLLLMALR